MDRYDFTDSTIRST